VQTFFFGLSARKCHSVTASTACFHLLPGEISLFYVETHKVSTSNRGGSTFYCTRHVMRGSFRTFIVNGHGKGSKRIRNWRKHNRMSSADKFQWKFLIFLSEPGRDLYWLRFREERFKIDCSVRSREGLDQHVPNNISSGISRHSDVGSNIGISSNVLRISRNQLMTESSLLRFELLKALLLCTGITLRQARACFH